MMMGALQFVIAHFAFDNSWIGARSARSIDFSFGDVQEQLVVEA